MKRFVPSLIGVCLAVGASAGPQAGFMGTKISGSTSPSGAAAAGPGLESFIQMVIALGIVLILLKAVIPKLAGKLGKKLSTGSATTLTIEETASFAGGNLYIVRARSKTLLLSASSTGVTCLSDLTETDTTPDLPGFQDMVDSASGKKPIVDQSELVYDAPLTGSRPEDPSPIEIALQRIERLAR